MVHTTAGAKPNLQYGVKPDEFQLITQDAPKALTDAHGGWSLESGIEKQQAEQVHRIIGMSTANAKQIRRWNIQKAQETFGRSEADTGSPEVQVAVWTVCIRNLEQHLTTHCKDMYNRRAY
jgi:ribosomal protein S15P/S13E